MPINHLVKVPGTPLADEPDLDPLEFVRTVAVARITMPTAKVRLSAGRRQMGESTRCCVSWPAPTPSSTATSCW
ncbi:Biotin synthase [Hydrogenophaga sp. T4]|nr:Biotin synthase [Hydrogenophaga sp. T4]